MAWWTILKTNQIELEKLVDDLLDHKITEEEYKTQKEELDRQGSE